MVVTSHVARSLLRLRAAAASPSAPSFVATSSIAARRVTQAGPSKIARRTLFTRKTPVQKLKSRAWTAAGLVLGGLLAVYAYDSSAGIHRWLVIPLLHAYTKDDPEESHRIAIKALASGLTPVDLKADQEDLFGFDLWGRHFSNPIGLAAGFDKHGEAIDGLFNLGFSYVEIGSITPQAQDGNPQPRFFRLPSSQSVINRYGFNSDGHLAVLERLQQRVHAWLVRNANILPEAVLTPADITPDPYPDPVAAILRNSTDAQVLDQLKVPRSLSPGKILAVNLGKNKASAAESIDDYVAGVQTLGPYADALVINVSSPNTPGLRSLQRREIVQSLLQEVVQARDELKLSSRPPILLKIAPDLSKDEVADIGAAAKASKIDGIIVSNTTISRPAAIGNDPVTREAGGLSGPPVKPLALRVLQTLYAYTEGEIPLVGCGGISTGQDALDYAKAGASFVQLYTALGYQGVGLPRVIKDEVAQYLQKEGKTWKQIVGSGIDLASIKALGRESNPANILSLEEEASDGLERLALEVEAAISGAKAKLPARLQTYEEKFATFLPDWSDYSPAVASQATTPSATTANPASPDSGIVPAGYPQILILDDDQKYSESVKPITAADVRAKWEETKKTAIEAEHITHDAAQEAFARTKVAAHEVGQGLKEDFREVGNVTHGALKESAAAFKELGHDIKEDPLAREAKKAAKESAAAFRELGHDIKEDPLAKEAKKSAKESADAFQQVGKDVKRDPLLAKAQEGAQDMKDEARYVAERFVREGARGEEERSGGGIWSLFSTFGERANVTSESKRLV